MAGFLQTWDRLGYITFKDAGHEVPLYTPMQAQLMFKAFIANNLPSLTASNVNYPSTELNVQLT